MNRRVLAIFAAAAIMLAAIAGTALLVNDTDVINQSPPASRSFNDPGFPDTIEGLTLSDVVSGPQAIAMISELHGTGISIKNGYIAQYSGSVGQIMIWVSESENSQEARQLFEIMDQKISAADKQPGGAAGPPFTNRRVMQINGFDVVAVQGMGMENYYYLKSSKNYWVAAAGVDPLKTLDKIMKTL